MFNRSILTLPAATYSSLHHCFSRVRNAHKAENKRERSVCVQCDFDIDCIQANNGYEHLKLSYHDGLGLCFSLPL